MVDEQRNRFNLPYISPYLQLPLRSLSEVRKGDALPGFDEERTDTSKSTPQKDDETT